MQLKTWSYLLILLFNITPFVFAEETVPEKEDAEKATVESKEKIKIDFLFNYYDQDGDHSPVTGGKGTEDQQVMAPVIIINIPFKKQNILDINIGLDQISSASTDKIDGATSSPSSEDSRVHANVWYTRKLSDPRQSLSFMGGFSKEYDVTSVQTGFRYVFQTLDQNQEFNITTQFFQDTWSLIYPLELRPDLADKSLAPLSDDTRQSINLSLSFSSVFNQNLQGSITVDITQQQGLLSTPFHRVYLDNSTTDIERLPDSRLKLALGLKLNYFINDYLTTRFFYRIYQDDFGILANSFELEIPVKLNQRFQIAPFYRYYMQSEADYFAPYQENDAGSEFHTSDYDLSEFNSHLFGLHFKYTTLWNPFFKSYGIDSFDFRISRYNRDDGLDANSISFGFSSSF